MPSVTVTLSDTSSTPARNDGAAAAAAPAAGACGGCAAVAPSADGDERRGGQRTASARRVTVVPWASLISVPRAVEPGFAAATVTCSGGISDCGLRVGDAVLVRQLVGELLQLRRRAPCCVSSVLVAAAGRRAGPRRARCRGSRASSLMSARRRPDRDRVERGAGRRAAASSTWSCWRLLNSGPSVVMATMTGRVRVALLEALAGLDDAVEQVARRCRCSDRCGRCPSAAAAWFDGVVGEDRRPLGERDDRRPRSCRPARRPSAPSTNAGSAVADVRDVVARGRAVVDEHARSASGRSAGSTRSTSRATLSSRTMKSDGPRSGTGAPASSRTLTYIERCDGLRARARRASERARDEQERGDEKAPIGHQTQYRSRFSTSVKRAEGQKLV